MCQISLRLCIPDCFVTETLARYARGPSICVYFPPPAKLSPLCLRLVVQPLSPACALYNALLSTFLLVTHLCIRIPEQVLKVSLKKRLMRPWASTRGLRMCLRHASMSVCPSTPNIICRHAEPCHGTFSLLRGIESTTPQLSAWDCRAEQAFNWS